MLLVDFQMEDPPVLSFRAGQYITLSVSDEPDPERRAYSIASLATRHEGFELVVKRVPGGRGSSLFDGLKEGDRLRFVGPSGTFVTEQRHAGDVVFGATGAGIAPVFPMLAEILGRPAEMEGGRVLLYWGLRRQEDLFLQERIDALKATSPRLFYHLCLSRPSPGWTGVHGHITEHVLESIPNLSEPTVYLVGNGDMVRDLRAKLLRRGMPRRRIHNEVFFPDVEP